MARTAEIEWCDFEKKKKKRLCYEQKKTCVIERRPFFKVCYYDGHRFIP